MMVYVYKVMNMYIHVRKPKYIQRRNRRGSPRILLSNNNTQLTET